MAETLCRWCKKPFPGGHRKVYCSEQCRKDAHAEIMRMYLINHRPEQECYHRKNIICEDRPQDKAQCLFLRCGFCPVVEKERIAQVRKKYGEVTV